jgi:MurNAc alpha-1-phosphate uridylyltransferase
MKAIILSSGKGTRMMPLTKDMPKPMLEVNGEPLIAHKIKLLEDASINEIFINVAYKKDVITSYIKSLNKNIHLIDEGDEPLGTAAGIRNIVSQLKDESFIVINSDIWTDYPLDQLKELDLNDNLAHIVLIETPDYLAGDFDINGEAITTGKKYVFSGIGKYHTELFKKYNDKDLGDILRAEEKISFSIYDRQWMDIGTPERLKQIKELM